jgi:hypothetical protein
VKKLIDKEELERIKAFIEKQQKTIEKYIKDVTSDLSGMSEEQYVESVCNGNISEGFVYECYSGNKNYFADLNRMRDLPISDYENRVKKATLERSLKDRAALVLVCIPDGDDFVKFAVPCPFAGSPICRLRNFKWVKENKDEDKSDKYGL